MGLQTDAEVERSCRDLAAWDRMIEIVLAQELGQRPPNPGPRVAALAAFLKRMGRDAEGVLTDEIKRIWKASIPKRGRGRPPDSDVTAAKTFRRQFSVAGLTIPPHEWVRLVRDFEPGGIYVPPGIIRAVSLWEALDEEERKSRKKATDANANRRVPPKIIVNGEDIPVSRARRFIERTFPELITWGSKKL